MNWSMKRYASGGVCLCLYSPKRWTVALGSNWLETMVKICHRGRLETTAWRRLADGPHLGRSAWLRARWPSPLLWCLMVFSRTFPSFFAEIRHDLVQFLDPYFSLAISVLIPRKSQFTKAMELVRLVPKKSCLVMVSVSSRVFQSVSKVDSLVGTPIIVNDIFVSIVSTSSSQWCALIHHSRCFYV
jgi:hypothetical protein